MASFVKRCGQNLWCFLAVFLACSVLQSMINTFLTSGIQSIERQFQIPSKKSGTLISASRVGYIPTILFLAYFGNKGNRAKWIGAGSLIITLGCLLAALPNFIFPSKPVYTDLDSKFVLNAIIGGSPNFTSTYDILTNPIIGHRIPKQLKSVMDKYENLNDMDLQTTEVFKFPNGTITKSARISFKSELIDNLSLSFPSDLSLSLMKQAQLPFGFCNSTVMKLKDAVKEETCRKRKAESSANEWAYGMVFLAITFFGVGQSLPHTLGTPLIDDSVKRKSAPFYFAAIRSIRIMGPIIGLWVGAGCFKLYVTLKDPPGLSPSDPRWIGAWWLGFLLIGALLLVPSLILFFYPDPSRFAKKNSTAIAEQDKKDLANKALLETPKHANETHSTEHTPKKRTSSILESINLEKQKIRFIDEVKTFGSSIFLCLKSPIYIGVLLGRLFDVFAFRGLSSFQSKFIENHYGMPQHQVAFFSGVVGGLSYAGGIILGSLIMRKFKLDGRRAAAYCLLCSFLSVVLTVSKVFLKCQSVNNAVGELLSSGGSSNLTAACNQNCYCSTSSLYPVCSRDGQPFFSPCHAGCRNFTLNLADSTTSVFSNCECSSDGDVSRDFCVSDCTAPLYLYFGITVITGIIAGTSGIPNMLISLRCVPNEVRSVSMAFSGFLVSLLSSAPSPIVVGTVIDSACLLWNKACGRQGACLLYDAGALRIRIHAMYGVLRATGLLFDVWVWYWAANLVLMKSDNKKDKNKNKKNSTVVENA